MAVTRSTQNRTALTLMELLIVVAILSLVAAMAVPLVQRSFESQRVNKAAVLVRAAMNKARVKAMRSGEVYGFYYFPDSRQYRVAPFNSDTFESLKSRRRDEVVVDSGENFDFGDDRLPQGIVFMDGEVLKDARSEDAIEDSSVSTRDVTPILFYPDGSSQSAKVLVRSEDEYTEIHLRGMTGTSRIVPIDDQRLPNRR